MDGISFLRVTLDLTCTAEPTSDILSIPVAHSVTSMGFRKYTFSAIGTVYGLRVSENPVHRKLGFPEDHF
jgi:hypothetical protein